jgi:phosphopantothenoylcysteine decarboxylase/phosphopantothenate--cysteine ligase
MNYLITAGPTREFIDDIRYISNLSSGRMGYALAAAAKDAGHHVMLISGPTTIEPPDGVDCTTVTSAAQMREVVLTALPRAEILVMCAAVADYRPARKATGKMKKGPETIQLEMVRNPDILAELGSRKENKTLVGFALETENALENARAKMAAKNTDMMVLNLASAIAAQDSEVQVLTPDGAAARIGPAAKSTIAVELIKMIDLLRKKQPLRSQE